MTGLLASILQNLNPSKSAFATPHNSTQGVSPKAQLIILSFTIVSGLYIGIRVWWSLRKEKMNKK